MMTGRSAQQPLARSASVSDIGKVRLENQDAVLADETLGLWLVADGMGGHAGGARASAIARDTVHQRFVAGDGLQTAVMAAHQAIREEQRDHPELNDMGTTIVALAEQGQEYEICWVGDSRAYRYAPASQRLERLTHDHNVAGVLVASGALTPDEATRHPQRHVLTDCLGLSGSDDPRIDMTRGRWQPDDIIVLCSDGLSGELEDGRIAAIIRQQPSARDIVRELLDEAMAAGARDNVSVVVIDAPKQLQMARQRRRWPFGLKFWKHGGNDREQ
ncbi:MAG: serine/threonine-protein phosphatase [Pseudomonadota bacterium]|nr:MAG: serine/threonine-protein phosphatase [Pseudomonadota bacterium]